MLAAGEWRNHSHFDGKTAGFHLNGLYSPLGWASWSELAEDFLRAKNDPAALRTFINTRLAETYEENYSAQVSAEGLMGRRLPYEPGTVPKDVVLLTAGVDVQLDRLEISVWGWSGAKGQPETGWLVRHLKLILGIRHSQTYGNNWTLFWQLSGRQRSTINSRLLSLL